MRDLDEPRLAKALIELLEHTPLTDVRLPERVHLPERATQISRSIASRRPRRRDHTAAPSATSNRPE